MAPLNTSAFCSVAFDFTDSVNRGKFKQYKSIYNSVTQKWEWLTAQSELNPPPSEHALHLWGWAILEPSLREQFEERNGNKILVHAGATGIYLTSAIHYLCMPHPKLLTWPYSSSCSFHHLLSSTPTGNRSLTPLSSVEGVLEWLLWACVGCWNGCCGHVAPSTIWSFVTIELLL